MGEPMSARLVPSKACFFASGGVRSAACVSGVSVEAPRNHVAHMQRSCWRLPECGVCGKSRAMPLFGELPAALTPACASRCSSC